MIIVDTALRRLHAEGRPIRVGLIGVGAMGYGVARQILTAVKGIRLAAISNRTISRAEGAYRDAGITGFARIQTPSSLEAAIDAGRYSVTDDPAIICEAGNIDAVVEMTGDVEFGAHVAMKAFEHGKHLIQMNAELSAAVGPVLKRYADRAGVVFTDSDGDQPGVIMNLYRYVVGTGFRPVLAGNVKGLQDPYRTPDTQKEYAAKYNLHPTLATSAADGTKISMEMALVANATGLKAGRRGMYGPPCGHVNEAVDLFPKDQMLGAGLVDYVLGAQPPGIFVLGYKEDPVQQGYLDYYKMGKGPFYTFYTPYHLCHFETPLTVARAVIFRDAAVTPLAGPVCDVVTIAKRGLKAGETIDCIGGFTCYGVLENYETSRAEKLLPMSLSPGCRLKRDVPIDSAITYEDVELPPSRLCDRLRTEQDELFPVPPR